MKHIVKSFLVNIYWIFFSIPFQQGDDLSPLFLNYSLGYINRKVHESQEELTLNGTYQLYVYADDINLLGDKIKIKK
jgi:hypothetical protein